MSRRASRSMSSSPAADPFEEAGDGGRVGGRHAVAQHLDRPERAEVAVALVVEGVVQRGRAVVDLGVQLRGRRRTRGRASRARRGSRSARAARPDGVAVVVEQRDGAREPHREGVGDVGARPVAQAPVDAVLWSSAAATSAGSTGRPRRRAQAPRGTAAAPGRRRTPHGRRGRRRGARDHHTRRCRVGTPGSPGRGTPRRAAGLWLVSAVLPLGTPACAAPGRRPGAPCRSRRRPAWCAECRPCSAWVSTLTGRVIGCGLTGTKNASP